MLWKVLLTNKPGGYEIFCGKVSPVFESSTIKITGSLDDSMTSYKIVESLSILRKN